MFNELQPRHGHHFSAGDTVFIINHGQFHTSVTGPTTIATLRQGAHGTPVLTCGSSQFFQDTHRGVDNPDMFLLPEGDPALDLVPQITQVRQVVNQIHHRASSMISNPSDENLSSLIESAQELIEYGDHGNREADHPSQEANETSRPVENDLTHTPAKPEPTEPEPAPENTQAAPSPVATLPSRKPTGNRPTRMRHGLTADGRPHDENAQVLNTRGAGRGLCSCGQLSEVLPSREARRQWMIEHKRESDLVGAA